MRYYAICSADADAIRKLCVLTPAQQESVERLAAGHGTRDDFEFAVAVLGSANRIALVNREEP
jgi:hypothetical protein